FLPLVENALSVKDGSSLIVGDEKQAIYRWRNGDAEQFINLPDVPGMKDNENIRDMAQTLHVHHKREQLDQNWRSSKDIVKFNNEFFNQITKNLDERTASFYSSITQDPQKIFPGYIRLEQLEAGKKNEEFKEPALNKTIEAIEHIHSKGYESKDITLLFRNNKEASYAASYLSERGIDVISSESLLLNENKEVRFILNILKFIYDNGDEVAKSAIVYHILEKKNQLSQFHETVTHYQNKHEFIELDQFLKDKGHTSVSSNLRTIAIYEIVETVFRSFAYHENASPYLAFLLELIHLFSNNNEGEQLKEFLEYWEEKKDKLSIVTPEGSNAVEIMTIHKSKGLQFPFVLIPFANWEIKYHSDLWLKLPKNILKLDRALLPTKKDLKNTYFADSYNEEVRKSEMDNLNLLYVAMTRAIHGLFLFTDDSTSERKISPYINNAISTFDEWDEENKFFERGEIPVQSDKPREKSDVETIDSLISSPWKDKLYISSQAPDEWDIESPDEKRQHGVLLHEALAGMKSYNDLQDSLERMLNNGMIDQKEKDGLVKELTSILEHDKMKEWFSPDVNARNEVELLTKDGES
ncbi:MAG: UvrD-helicase domain-containing protein, partial [Flavobacteriales bacterium]